MIRKSIRTVSPSGRMAAILAILILTAAASAGALGQEKKQVDANYELAARFTPDRLDEMIFDSYVDPHWLQGSDRFWYSFETSEGTNYYIVDPRRASKTPLFDNVKIANALTRLTNNPYNNKHLPIEGLTFSDDERSVRFDVDGSHFIYDIASETLSIDEDYRAPAPKPAWASFSPDGKTIVFARGHDLYMMDADDPDSTEHRLTTDGEQHYSYAGRGSENSDKRIPARVNWSDDSRKFFVIRSDERKVGDLWVIHSLSEPRPTLETYKYSMPGEEHMPQYEILVFDRESRKKVRINADKWQDQIFSGSGRLVRWGMSSDRLYFGRVSRDFHRYELCTADPETGTAEALFEERSNTYLEPKPVHVINGGNELIHWSEQDGYGHFYLYDGAGNLKNRITSGPFVCIQVARIDTLNRQLYFIACGREQGEDPYYWHLYRTGFDGRGFTLLNPGNYMHYVNLSPTGRYFVDQYSRIDTAPVSALRDNTGRLVMELEKADLSLLTGAGFKFPEPFSVKAADGVTDLYGVMWKPFDFDPQKRYPIIAYVYPGPQSEYVPKAFQIIKKDTGIFDFKRRRIGMQNVGLSQFGFIVIVAGQRGGHPHRSKAYHNYGYDNLRDYGLADKKTTIEQLAARHSFIDIDRVGIYGYSGGGFMSTAAMLVYPDFFKVAVSGAGNHDNNIYNHRWSEKQHGVKEVTGEDGTTRFDCHVPTNQELAKNLKGHLLLHTGEVDNNVHPGITYRMADALIKANKRFDMFVFPGFRHEPIKMNPYLFWLRGDYFCKHLLGSSETGADIIHIPAVRK